MPKLNFRQPGLTYCACGTFTKSKERIQGFKEARDSTYIYKKELEIVCFQHVMTYGDYDLWRF